MTQAEAKVKRKSEAAFKVRDELRAAGRHHAAQAIHDVVLAYKSMHGTAVKLAADVKALRAQIEEMKNADQS